MHRIDTLKKIAVVAESLVFACNLAGLFFTHGFPESIPWFFLFIIDVWIVFAWAKRWQYSQSVYFLRTLSFELRSGLVFLLSAPMPTSLFERVSNLKFQTLGQDLTVTLNMGDATIPLWGLMTLAVAAILRMLGWVSCCVVERNERIASQFWIWFVGLSAIIIISHGLLMAGGATAMFLLCDIIGFYGFKVFI